MSEIHNKITLSNIEPIDFCGKVILYKADINQYITPFEIKPTIGEHDFNKCSDCKTMLAELTTRLKSRFEGVGTKKGFPYCCIYHKNLIRLPHFHISDFLSVPVMAATKIIYTNHHIINNYNSENWLKNITDYIDWAIDSFGHMPADCGEPLYLSDYFSYVTHLINQRTEIPLTKKKQILDHLNLYQIPNNRTQTDINILLDTYKRWLKIFPFDLNSYFGNLKEIFENHVPLLTGKGEANMHSGKVQAKFHTKKSLFEDLIKVTDDLLTRTNGKALYENGVINDTNKIKIELINGKRKLQLNKGYTNSSPDEEHRYRKMINDWFKDEKNYFKEISPLLKSTQPKNMESSINPIQFMEFKKSSFYSNLIDENNFTAEESDELYQFIIDTIKLLEKIRSDELKSHNLVIDQAKGLDKNPIFDRISRMFENWLVKALKNDDSYVYAFNYLAQKKNREMHMKVYDIKFLSDSELFFLLQKEKDQYKKTESTIILPEQPEIVIQDKLSLKEYKKKLDFTLIYYRNFPQIVQAYKYNDKELLTKSIVRLKSKQNYVYSNKVFLTEQLHFDLIPNDINLFYNYGFKKIEEIILSFKTISEGISNWFDNDNFNIEIHHIWHNYSDSDHPLIIFSTTHKGFVKHLHQSLRRNLYQFKKDFTNSSLLSNDIIILPTTFIKDKNKNVNSKKYAPANKNINSISKLPKHNKFNPIENNFSIQEDPGNIALLLYHFSNYFLLESKTESVSFGSIPGHMEIEVYRKDVDDYADFNLIFEREYNSMHKSSPFLPMNVFCELETEKIQQWIKKYEKFSSESTNDDFNPNYPDGYLRAKSYLLFLASVATHYSTGFPNKSGHGDSKETFEKTFPEYILHSDNILIADNLKSAFKGKKGKAIRLMIEVLKNQTIPLISYENRQRTEIYKAMKQFFPWDIGTYQSIWNYKRNHDEIDYKAIEVIVLKALAGIKNN